MPYLDYENEFSSSQAVPAASHSAGTPRLSTNCIDMGEPVNLGSGDGVPKIQVHVESVEALDASDKGCTIELLGTSDYDNDTVDVTEDLIVISSIDIDELVAGDIHEVPVANHSPRQYFGLRYTMEHTTNAATFTSGVVHRIQEAGIHEAHTVGRVDIP
ncbi:MAG: hypothetical protein ACOC0J_00980 [Myxococcota bacterium]